MPSPTLFVDDLTICDFAYFCAERGLCGESWRVGVELRGALDHRGFIMDFGQAKKKIKAWIDQEYDHRFLLPATTISDQTSLEFESSKGKFSYRFPREAIATYPGTKLEPQVLADHWAEKIKPHLPSSISSVHFQLLPALELVDKPHYSYTHGLRFHEGNCQRLWHGHKNPIQVWLNGTRSQEWENILANDFQDKHFTHKDIIQNLTKLDLCRGVQNKDDIRAAELSYRAPQGEFFAIIPVSQLVVLDTEPSVENIATFSAAWLLEKYGIQSRVKCYEGLNKGAWSS